MIDVDKKVNHGEFFKQIKEVYSYLEDDISRNLFNARMKNITKLEFNEIINNSSPLIQECVNNNLFKPINTLPISYSLNISIPRDKTLILYGANEHGKKYYEQLSKHTQNIMFCDIYSDEITEFCGLPVISLEDLVRHYRENPILIVDDINHTMVYDFMVKYNLNVIRNEEPFIVFSANSIGIGQVKLINHTNNTAIFCVMDDDIHSDLKEFEGIPIITLDELVQNYSDRKIIFADSLFTREKYEFIKTNAFENVYLNIIIDCEGQYFDECIKLSENEIFLDCGVLDASTSLLFAKNTNYKYKKIIMCEPNSDVHSDILKNTKGLENIELKKVGVWNEKDTLKFNSCNINLGASKITDDGEISIEVDTIDNILNGEEVTFIKMDIEGAELNALKGASETIKKYKPKLAISLYHKPEDITEIPAFIKSLVPEYKMYIRHYSNVFCETVLYAVL